MRIANNSVSLSQGPHGFLWLRLHFFSCTVQSTTPAPLTHHQHIISLAVIIISTYQSHGRAAAVTELSGTRQFIEGCCYFFRKWNFPLRHHCRLLALFRLTETEDRGQEEDGVNLPHLNHSNEFCKSTYLSKRTNCELFEFWMLRIGIVLTWLRPTRDQLRPSVRQSFKFAPIRRLLPGHYRWERERKSIPTIRTSFKWC